MLNSLILISEITTSGAQDFSLVNGTVGQVKVITMVVDGGDATNCITGVDFLEAFCDGRLKVGSKKVGDCSIILL